MEQEGVDVEDADMFEDVGEIGGMLRKGKGGGRTFPKFAYERDFGDLLDNSVFDIKQ